jgi:chromosome segregation ATPase
MEQHRALEDVIGDEVTRFKAALRTSHTTGNEVLAALDQLISTMNTAHTEFTRSFEENKAKRVAEAEHSIQASDELIRSSEEQIQAIQEKIASLRTKRETDARNAQNEMVRLEGVRGGFESALAQVVGRLNALKGRLAAIPKV